MSVRNLAAAGLALVALGGLLVVVGLPPTVGTWTRLGVALGWSGLLLVSAALLRLGRIHHQMLRAEGELVHRILDGLRTRDTGAAAAPELEGALVERFDELQRTTADALDLQRRELLRAVDARILGIHETLREVGGADPS